MSNKSIIAVSALALMIVPACSKSQSPGTGGGQGPQAVTATATITISSGVCTQTVTGASPNDYPNLIKANGDSITFKGSVPSQPVTVTFAALAGSLPFQFATYTNQENSGAPTGPPNTASNNYVYQDVVVGYGSSALHCANPQGMGVHIN